MALPDLSEMNAYELMKLAENLNLVKNMLETHRRSEGRPTNDIQSIEELVWLQRILYGDIIKQALETLPLDHVLHNLGTEMGWLRGKGPERDYIYILAWFYKEVTDMKPMQIYYQWVRPVLLANGAITLTPKNEPDPTEDLAARSKFLKALARFKKTSGK